MGYDENVKNYNSIRSTLRELYVDGYKTRKDYINDETGKRCSKSVDSRIRLVLNILKDVYSSSSFSKEGKVSYISIDSRADITNPLYRTFEAKSFDEAGLILYFLIMELLSDGKKYLLTDIEDILFKKNVHNITYWGGQAKDETVPHRDTLRNWLKKFVDCGVIQKTRIGNKDAYSIIKRKSDWSDYSDAASFFSEVAPLGMLGSFLKKDLIQNSDISNIIYKHHFIVSAIDSEVLEVLLTAIREQRTIEIKLYKYDDKSKEAINCTPVKIYSSTRSGRQYALVYNNKSDAEIRFQFIRLDKIKTIQVAEIDPQFTSRLTEVAEIMPYVWGVKLPSKRIEPYKVTMTVAVDLKGSHPEGYIVERLKKEGRGGKVEIIDDKSCRYERMVYSPEEMLPWIRTFYGRIISFECDAPSMKETVIEDIREMYGESYDFQ